MMPRSPRLTALSSVLLVLLVVCLVSPPAEAANASRHSGSGGTEVYRAGSYTEGSSHNAVRPVPVPGLQDIVTVEASNSSSYALQCVGGSGACAQDGVVWAWGFNTFGQLGNGSSGSSYHPNPVKVQLPLPPGVGVVAIGEARNEAFAVDSTGQGYGWGANGQGSLCLGTNRVQLKPVQIPLMTGVDAAPGSVQGAADHVLWLMANGSVEACGNNAVGQLGTGNTQSSAKPVTAIFPAGASAIVQISAGVLGSGAIDTQGNAYMWGGNALGQAGLGFFSGAVAFPTRVASLPASVVELYVGGDTGWNGHAVALLSNHQVFAWGYDLAGQLGDRGRRNADAPVQVKIPTAVTFTHVAAGGTNSEGLDSNGKVWQFGKVTPLPISGVDMLSMTAKNVLYHL